MKERKNSFGIPCGTQEFAFKNAALELYCLSEDINVSDLMRMTGVSRACMNAYLRDGKENKAYAALKRKLPKSLFK